MEGKRKGKRETEGREKTPPNKFLVTDFMSYEKFRICFCL